MYALFFSHYHCEFNTTHNINYYLKCNGRILLSVCDICSPKDVIYCYCQMTNTPHSVLIIFQHFPVHTGS